jgi:hypothetical protein
MCTVSWSNQPNGYTLFFNRDESRKRQDGVPPELGTHKSTQFICPRDPEGGGTWLLVNAYSLTLGLLNFYEADVNYQPAVRRSRGNLPLEYAHCKQLTEVEAALAESDFSSYPPFHFLAVGNSGEAFLMTWDGQEKVVSRPQWEDLPISTSSFKTSEVMDRRKQLFKSQMMEASDLIQRMEAYHTAKNPSPDTHAVLMTRPDAKTVSVTRIDVNHSEVKMTYCARLDDSSQLELPVTKTLSRR